MLDIRGAAVGGGRVRATDGKLGKGRKRKRGGRVYLCAYMLFFHGLTQLMLVHTKQ